jgi:hypothetical protein
MECRITPEQQATVNGKACLLINLGHRRMIPPYQPQLKQLFRHGIQSFHRSDFSHNLQYFAGAGVNLTSPIFQEKPIKAHWCSK